jgi:hypothetical protein
MNWLPRAARVVAVCALAGTALFGVAAAASATPDDPPVSGDDRATVHDGNAVGKDCPTLFPGSTVIDEADLTVTEDATYLDITGVADGVEVLGVIVKGGSAYNLYEPANLGDLPWLDLHSPLVSSGKPADISHWFACGVEDTTTTTTTTPSSPTSETSTTTTTSDSPSVTTSPSTSTPGAVVPAASEDELADTGYDGGWMVAVGSALLLAGAAVLLILRLRGARR